METQVSERLGIKQIIADCERYWLDTKVPRSRVREMATELESHLLEAAAEGKTPEAVVGDGILVLFLVLGINLVRRALA